MIDIYFNESNCDNVLLNSFDFVIKIKCKKKRR